MPVPINTFKQQLAKGQLQLGLWSSLAHHLSVEILALFDFDWLVLDTEHAPNELPMIVQQLQATRGAHVQPVVRPWVNDPVVIKRLLDAGAQSLLIPMVESAAEARAAVAATRYAPAGVRGFASIARASNYGLIADYFETYADEICVLVQVESRRALEHLEAIAAVDGVDGIFIGPGDLSADLGYLGQPAAPAVQEVIGEAIVRIRAAGKPAGILSADVTLAKSYIERGALFVALGSDVGLLTAGAQRLLGQFGR